jgi:hypothetical protein
MRGLNVFVNIGAKLLPSLNESAGAVERRFGLMNRKLRVQAAETRVAMREFSAAASPLLGLAAAGGLLWSAKKVIGDGAALSHELQNLRNAGLTANETAKAFAAANRTITALPTSTILENLKMIGETRMAYGDLGHAIDNLTFNAKVGGMMNNLLGEGDNGDRFNSIVRALEMRGAAMDPARYQRETGLLYQAMIATHGKVDPASFLAYSQQANPYTKGMSNRYLYGIAPSLIQEFGGERAGQMQNTFTGTILGKAKNKISTEAWMKLGLLDPKQVVYNKVGPVGWRPGAIKGTDLALRDPLAFMEQVLIPALKSHGFQTNDQLSLAKALMPLFRDRNANRLANVLTYDTDRQRLKKDEGIIRRVPNVNAAYAQTLRNDPIAAWGALKSSLTNLSSVIFGTGKGESPVAVALVNIAKGINSVAQIIEAHPMLGKGIGFLLLGSAGMAGLRVMGMGLRFALAPLGLLVRLLSSNFVWKALGGLRNLLGPTIMRVLGGVFRMVGPLLFRLMGGLGGFLLRGLAIAFEFLSGPVGWAILAVTVIAIIWRFRHSIANAWNTVVVPWFRTAWDAIKAYALSIDWRGIGMSIANALTFGLAGKFADAMSRLKASAGAGANVGMNSTRGGLTGARASGGPVRRGGLYLVGERGPELFRAGAGGHIFSHARTAAMIAGAAAAMSPTAAAASKAPLSIGKVEIHIHDAHDPEAVAREVEKVLHKLSREQSYNLSD